MKRHKQLYESVCSFENLYAAAVKAMKGKRGKRPGAGFYAEMEDEIITLQKQLLDGTYCHGGYHYFEIHEPKQRTVAAAEFRDRVVHHAVIRVIEPLFERRFIEDSYACRVNKGTHAGMKRAAHYARRFDYALKCDIRKYFAHIDHEILLYLFAKVIGDKQLLDLLQHVIGSHRDGWRMVVPKGGLPLFDGQLASRGLPIGNLTSQFSANVYLNPLDHFVKHDLRCKGYVRYMDDFLLFSNDKHQLRDWGDAVREIVNGLRLKIHPDKYRLLRCDCGVDFCGFVVFGNGRIRVRRSTARRFHRRYQKNLEAVNNCLGDAASLSQSVAAWVGHVKHAQSWNLRKAVLCGS
ncbi:Group II intron-encoded protein LtrA [Sedimentisphaera cyanobacteriorum]|uniref:Group II intron-encoded protein LtrA n=1 Tax=Sedimentisphaera cyanobacteriorum TaxID=1940790 RepID=A0A1Q2HQV2_9BACT|nr:reverse transcriptase/maturase family protein [Sedimentisphaera cyanobacteriorum]AQQ09839.1 Group II intron-encoded protein LtrA [Sedimentisphaera cyanobacteriorum]